VAVINGLLGGVTIALAVVTAARAPLPVTAPSGMASGTLILALHVAYQVRRFARMRSTVEALFPSPRERSAMATRRVAGFVPGPRGAGPARAVRYS
jgi:hypothetical protein